MNYLFWNIRGLGKGEKISTIRTLVVKNKVSFMGLVETKHRRSINSRIKRMWGSGDYDVCEVHASDIYSGGIFAIWDAGTFCASKKHCGERWIIIKGSIKMINFECCVGVIYSPNDRVGRITIYEELKILIVSINRLVLLLGDFNVILQPSESIGIFRCNLSMRDFSEWIQSLGLIDIPLHGIKFTWRRNDSKSRLDRGLCCNVWLWKFPNLSMMGLKKSFF